mmetsp:Transcript_64615/g.180629  ORF Transcript_64615/g.180629 Transcript_64615/m.180629 type:complete len:81 (-) Transcript_64615:626-868(-)
MQGSKRRATLATKDYNQTVDISCVKAGLTIGKIIVPRAEEHIIKTQTTDKLLTFVEPTAPISQGLSIVKSNIVNVFKTQI